MNLGLNTHQPARRISLKLLGGLTLFSVLIACNREVGQAVAREPGSDTACVLDGMLLTEFPGPKGQVHYAEGEPDFFCDLIELFTALLAPEQKRPIAAVFVQDVSKIDWAHPVGNWIDANTAFYVTGSRKRGSMGPTFASFSSRQDAEKFQKEEGGNVLPFGQITPAMAGLSSGVANDTTMSR